MPNVTIDELTPITSPANTQQIELDDGLGGSFKATLGNIPISTGKLSNCTSSGLAMIAAASAAAQRALLSINAVGAQIAALATIASGSMLYASAANTIGELVAGTNGYTLQMVAGVPAWVSVPPTAPAGANTEIQYNNAGAFGASATFTFAVGILTAPAITLGAGTLVAPAVVVASGGIYDTGTAMAFAWAGTQQLRLELGNVVASVPIYAPATTTIPTYAFVGEGDTGVGLLAANTFGLYCAGGVVFTAAATAVTSAVQMRTINGTAGAPGYSFGGTNGVYTTGTDVRFSVAGALNLTLGPTLATFVGTIQTPNGSSGTPGVASSADTNTGVFWDALDGLFVSSGGNQVAVFKPTYTQFEQRLLIAEDGTAGTPALKIGDANDHGFYAISATALGLAIQSTLRQTFSTTSLTSTVPFLANNGTVGAPSHSFSGGATNGMYLVTTNTVGIATNGIKQLEVSTTAVTSSLEMHVAVAGSAAAPALRIGPSTIFSGLIDSGAGAAVGFVGNSVHIMNVDQYGINWLSGGIACYTGAGLKIGTTTTDKLGFWNATPVAQQASADQAAVATTAATNVAPWGFTTQAQADAIITLLNRLRLDNVTIGIIKGAA